jgi:hypothetical protein
MLKVKARKDGRVIEGIHEDLGLVETPQGPAYVSRFTFTTVIKIAFPRDLAEVNFVSSQTRHCHTRDALEALGYTGLEITNA